ncbi:MAG: class I SAM-dependent DNA methyltransferase [Brachymonas sp.]|nr:class I SAM-dependent DNA methyltransferase [Brachymonas sp.]
MQFTANQLTTNEIRSRLAAFAHQWQHASSEEADEKLFTAAFLACFGIGKHQYKREYAVPRADGSTGYMDGFIPGLLIIEGKSLGKNLDKAREQAESYRWGCPTHERPRYVLLHDFGRFALFDLSHDTSLTCALAELPAHADRFRFLLGEEPTIVEETEANRRAAEQIAELHEALLQSNFTGRDLETFLVRLLFCFFADDTAIFGNNNIFLRLLEQLRPDGANTGAKLNELFDTLNTPIKQRSPLLDETLQAFAYINGHLFEQRTRIPAFNSTLHALLLQCARYDWASISPAIFGSMFQSVLEKHEPDQNPATPHRASRRELGAHYTSERNILRAINPLFMDGLRAQLAAAGKNPAKLQTLYDQLPTLRLLDPACGCGNFLVIAYRELRLFEMELIERLYFKGKGRGVLDVADLSRVTVNQFYGIEIDASAAHIAQVALWITDHQMNLLCAQRFGTTRPSVPLTASAHILQANALRTDWAELLPPAQCSYIVGNPPFVGAKYQSAEQCADVAHIASHIPSHGLLDYVACWHIKATAYMQANPAIATAFVSTNSICQGEQVPILWAHLLAQGTHIHFAHRTFKWSNEGKGVAAVHCIIIGFALHPAATCRIYDYSDDIAGSGSETAASHINPYLLDAPAVLIEKRSRPMQTFVPEMTKGSQPSDGGNLLLNADEAAHIRATDPIAAQYIRPFLGADEFINNTPRYCLWLTQSTAADRSNSPELKHRIAKVKAVRDASRYATSIGSNLRPAEFERNRQPSAPYLLIPSVSSENRRFIPIGFLQPHTVASNLVFTLPNATHYEFAILSSTMHNAWMRTVAGRLESRYRYSNTIVYNNYPWPPNPSEKQRQAIETAAAAVLAAREQEFATCAALGQHCSLAMLYNPTTMPAELVKAHTALDRAVDAAYAYKGGKDDASRVAYLFAQYQQLATPLAATPPAKRTRAARRPAAPSHQPPSNTTP